MKRKSTLPVLFICCLLVYCRHKGGISIHYSESKDYYGMNAWFDERKTRAVEEYMDDKIGRRSDISFVNTRIDGSMRLDNRITIFINKFPGHLKIELDKRKNSADSYRQIKSLCEGIKEVLK